MKPLKLKMQAFGSYGKETAVDFEKVDQNLFLITGDTGAGKTTIFDAIVFALYGEASSSANKKDGVVLQSQYVDFAYEPFVELTFSDNDEIYTVRRVPRHLKTITRGASKGKPKETPGSVSLIMPDGTEYPAKETDRKLQEITGLTKSQFMQVAMIAQGEFMDLLRAKSDDKKVIFRKLFNTEMYQDIVNELANRKREKDKEVAILKTQCQGDAGRICIPEEYAEAPAVLKLKKQLEEGQMANLSEFLESLEKLCQWMEDQTEDAQKKYKDADAVRSRKQEELTRGEELLKWFYQLEKAERDLEKYQQQEVEIQKMKQLAVQIRDAYEIQITYEQLTEANKLLTDTETALNKQTELLPGFQSAEKMAKEKENTVREEFNQKIKELSAVNEKVQKAREIFDQIEEKTKAVEADQKAAKKAEEDFRQAEQSLEKLEGQEILWKKQSEELEDTDKNLAQWEAKVQEEQNLEQELETADKLKKQAMKSLQEAKDKKAVYGKISIEYQELNGRYEQLRQAVLNEQAGLLAAELVPGKPCRVCGATEHPHPFIKKVEHVDISSENLEKMRADVDNLRKKQETASTEAGAAGAEYNTRKNTYVETIGRLQERIQKYIPEIHDKSGLTEMKEALNAWKKSILETVKKLQKDAQDLKKIRQSLQKTDEQKQALRESLENYRKVQKEAETRLVADRAELKSLCSSCEFRTKQEAMDLKKQAETAKTRAEKVYKNADADLKKASQSRQNAETLIEKYKNEIPVQKEQADRKKDAYENIKSEKNLSESQWKTVTEENRKEEEHELLETVNKYNENRTAARIQKESAAEAIGKAEKPDIKILQTQKETADQNYKNAEKIYNEKRQNLRDNKAVLSALSEKTDKRKTVLEEHRMIDTLYRMASGNVSGARMDLETYVQRYYLERVLYAANRRFQEMSGGQFELRMYDLEKAGEGRNKGLDLMVYSTVTGKEREVRTLSGGESFMAALSLALGMADQIQESSAAVNLDMMFIDEGFGSLDEHSRNQAVRVLLEMAEGSRLIGIISHVTELKQEIEDQLLVTKDEDGSHVKWQIS
ncbi:SbcC/MukB-like Walker B domain-containing protein [Blautia sp. HCP28S3_G10]|uniref:SbcC/MukB-like Walker B domain-containing protein n=1 Tax=Blautia sp. HCP28S3_G10 TaxID=3438908 RepID=UPI003F8C57E1